MAGGSRAPSQGLYPLATPPSLLSNLQTPSRSRVAVLARPAVLPWACLSPVCIWSSPRAHALRTYISTPTATVDSPHMQLLLRGTSSRSRHIPHDREPGVPVVFYVLHSPPADQYVEWPTKRDLRRSRFTDVVRRKGDAHCRSRAQTVQRRGRRPGSPVVVGTAAIWTGGTTHGHGLPPSRVRVTTTTTSVWMG